MGYSRREPNWVPVLSVKKLVRIGVNITKANILPFINDSGSSWQTQGSLVTAEHQTPQPTHVLLLSIPL